MYSTKSKTKSKSNKNKTSKKRCFRCDKTLIIITVQKEKWGSYDWQCYNVKCDMCNQEITQVYEVDYQIASCTNINCNKGLDLYIQCYNKYKGEVILSDHDSNNDSNNDNDNDSDDSDNDSDNDSENENDNGSYSDTYSDDTCSEPAGKKQKLLNGRSKARGRMKSRNGRNTRKRR